MKFTLPANALKPSIESAAALAPGNYIRPILETVLLEVADDGVLSVSATDFATASCYFNVKGSADPQVGRTCVPVSNLLQLVKRAGKAPFSLSWTESDNHASVAFGRTTANLPVEHALDYPMIRRFDESAPYVTLPAESVLGILSRTAFATAGEFKSRALAGIHLRASETSLTAISTDGVRMAYAAVDFPAKPSTTFTSVVLPIPVTDFRRMAPEGNVDLQVRDGFLYMRGICGERVHNEMAVSFPEFDLERQLNLTKSATVQTRAFRDLLERALLLKSKDVSWTFCFADNVLTIEACSSLDGRVEVSTDIEWSYKPFEIKLSPFLLLEAVKTIKADVVEFSCESPRQPVRLREASDNFLFLYALGAQV